MRLHPSLLLALLAAPPPAAAQTRAVSDGWHLGGGVSALRFGHVAVSDAAPGVAAEVRPSGRAGLHLAVARTAGAWSVWVEAGYAGGCVEAANDAVAIQDRSADVSRHRLAAALERRLASVGTGTVGAGLLPTLDLWTVNGEGRLRGGLEARLVLRVPLGAVELEHSAALGLSGNPIESADVGDVAELRGLRTWGVGVGLRVRI